MHDWLTEVVTLNGKQYRASVDRTKRQIILSGEVPIVPTDIIVVKDMTGVINDVEHNEDYTKITLGS